MSSPTKTVPLAPGSDDEPRIHHTTRAFFCGVVVEGAGEGVGEAEEEHGGDPAAGVLEGEAALGHAVLADEAAGHPVHGAGRVDVGLEVARLVVPLLAREDVEVIVGRVAARVALRADRRPEDDQVLGDAWVERKASG